MPSNKQKNQTYPPKKSTHTKLEGGSRGALERETRPYHRGRNSYVCMYSLYIISRLVGASVSMLCKYLRTMKPARRLLTNLKGSVVRREPSQVSTHSQVYLMQQTPPFSAGEIQSTICIGAPSKHYMFWLPYRPILSAQLS